MTTGLNHVLRTEQQRLRVNLTEEEMRRKSTELIDAMSERRRFDDEQAEVKAQLKRKLAQLDGKVGGLHDVLQAGYEYRPVDVDHVADYTAGVVRQVRSDTGEEIECRRMHESERQVPLDALEPEGQPDSCGVTIDGRVIDIPWPVTRQLPPPEKFDDEKLDDEPEPDLVDTRIAFLKTLLRADAHEQLTVLELEDLRATYTRATGEKPQRKQRPTMVREILAKLGFGEPEPA